MIAFVTLAAVGTFFLFLGFLIWYFKIAGAIAGYDSTKVTSPDELAKWVGKCMMGTGLLAWGIGLVGLLVDSENSNLVAFITFMIGSMLSMVATLAGIQRYIK